MLISQHILPPHYLFFIIFIFTISEIEDTSILQIKYSNDYHVLGTVFHSMFAASLWGGTIITPIFTKRKQVVFGVTLLDKQ